MIKTVIFDFDGTIADTFLTIIKLFNKKAKEFGMEKVESEEIEKLQNLELKSLLQKFSKHLLKLPYIAKTIRQDLKTNIKSIKIFPGIRQVIHKLKQKNFRLGIVSSNSQENIQKFLQIHKLEVFDFIYSEKNIFGKGKKLAALLKKFNLNKEEVIYIGDEVRDIDACRENGIKIISVTWGFNKKEILKDNNPDYIIDKPQKILKIL